MAIIFTNGCFDICHPGHMQLLLLCRYLAEGDPVYVAIDSDKKIRRDKGLNRPYFTQEERKTMLLLMTRDGHLDSRGLGDYVIDWVDIFDTDRQLHALVEKYQPDLIVKGSDYKGKLVVGSDIAPVHYAQDYYKEMLSTSAIEKRILERNLR